MISPIVLLGERSDMGSLLQFLWQQREKDGFGFYRPLAKYCPGLLPRKLAIFE